MKAFRDMTVPEFSDFFFRLSVLFPGMRIGFTDVFELIVKFLCSLGYQSRNCALLCYRFGNNYNSVQPYRLLYISCAFLPNVTEEVCRISPRKRRTVHESQILPNALSKVYLNPLFVGHLRLPNPAACFHGVGAVQECTLSG
jgi:hypothetical protein